MTVPFGLIKKDERRAWGGRSDSLRSDMARQLIRAFVFGADRQALVSAVHRQEGCACPLGNAPGDLQTCWTRLWQRSARLYR